MHITIEKKVSCRKKQKLGLAGALLVASCGLAAAQESDPQRATQYKAVVSQPEPRGPQSWNQNRFHDAGTAGRLDLGADPQFPEGPGNTSD